MTVSAQARGAPRLAAHIDGIAIDGGVAATGVSWLSAPVAAAGDWRCAVSPERRFPLAGAFAVTVGDPAFDARRTVRTTDGPLARAWLDRRARDRLLAADGYHFVIDGGLARAFTMDPVASAEPLIAAAHALAALAGRGRELGRAWRDLAARLGVMVQAGAAGRSLRIPLARTVVAVDAFAGGLARRLGGRGLFVRVRCPRTGGASDRFALRDRGAGRGFLPSVGGSGQRCTIGIGDDRYAAWADEPAALLAHLAGAADLLADAHPELVVGDSQAVTLFFLGVDVATARIRAGVDLAGQLAVGSRATALASPYR